MNIVKILKAAKITLAILCLGAVISPSAYAGWHSGPCKTSGSVSYCVEYNPDVNSSKSGNQAQTRVRIVNVSAYTVTRTFVVYRTDRTGDSIYRVTLKATAGQNKTSGGWDATMNRSYYASIYNASDFRYIVSTSPVKVQ